MKLKLDENGNVVTVEKEGVTFPVYVHDDGTEVEADVPSLFSKISELNTEAKNYRQEKSALKDKFKLFESIDDLEDWKKKADTAIETVKNYDDKQLVEAGKVDEIKSQMKEVHEEEIQNVHNSYKDKMSEYEGEKEKDQATIYKLMVSTRFAQSPFFSGKDPKSTLPPEMAEAYFGKHFKVEDDGKGELRVVGYKADGKTQILSKKNPGDIAGFEEALEKVVDEYPYKDNILRATGGGSGSGGGDGGSGLKGVDAKIAGLEEQLKEAKEAKDGTKVTTLTTKIHQLKVQKQTGQAA